MKVAALTILVAAGACHNSGVSTDGPVDNVVDASHIDGTHTATFDAPSSSATDASRLADASASSIDANGSTHVDATGSNSDDAHVAAPDAAPDAGVSMFPIGQAGDSDCWSDGGFGYVRPDAPGYVVATLSDQDGVADIAMTADIVIYGATSYAVGTSPLISLGQTGCCTITVKAAVTYDDLIETANAVGGPPDGQFWGAQATFHDSAGNATTAYCYGDETEWHAEPD